MLIYISVHHEPDSYMVQVLPKALGAGSCQ